MARPADIVVLYLLNDSLASLSSDRQEALGVTKYSKHEQAIAERQWLCIPVVAETYRCWVNKACEVFNKIPGDDLPYNLSLIIRLGIVLMWLNSCALLAHL